VSTRPLNVESRPFQILGIGEAEEQAYRWLLAHAGATVHELASALKVTVHRAQHLLDAIEARGLATHSPERPRRYLPGSPDMAIEALILHHHRELQRARVAAQELRAAGSHHDGGSEEIVELITSHEAEWQAFEQMQRSARSEVLFFVRPPMRLQRLRVDDDFETPRRMLAAGVSYRCLIEAEFLRMPGAAARVQSDLRSGEQIRVLSHLPFKFVLVDRRIALVPLDQKSTGGSALLVRASALIDAFYALFEILWQRAAPISFTRNVPSIAIGENSTDEMDELVALLAMGINDKAVASELHCSARTLNRRIGEMMEKLDARSRFQAGWLAAFRSMAMKEHARLQLSTARERAERSNGANTTRRKSAGKSN
jgi:DNA-binding MarR family transcriptional regulator